MLKYKLIRKLPLPDVIIDLINSFIMKSREECASDFDDVMEDIKYGAGNMEYARCTVMDVCRDFGATNWIRHIEELLILGSFACEMAADRESFITTLIIAQNYRDKLSNDIDTDIINAVLFSIFTDTLNYLYCECYEHNIG